MLTLVISALGAEPPAPPPQATIEPARRPVCQLVYDVFATAGPEDRKRDMKRELKARLDAVEDVTAEDIPCVRDAIEHHGLPSYAISKVQTELVERHGLAALPTSPVEVFAVLPDPRLIARGQNALGTDLATLFGFGSKVDQYVLDQVLSQARAAVAATGVPAQVTLNAYQLPSMNGAWFNGATWQLAPIAPGLHYVLRVYIPDSVLAARITKGDLLVALGARMGKDIDEMVEDNVLQMVYTSLAQGGAPSLIVHLTVP